MIHTERGHKHGLNQEDVDSDWEWVKKHVMSFYKFVKKLHFRSPLKETNNRSFSNSLSMVFLAAPLINLHRRSCAPWFLVADSCRQRGREWEAPVCWKCQDQPMQECSAGWNQLGVVLILLVTMPAGSKQHLQVSSYLGLNPFSCAAAPDLQRNVNFIMLHPSL